MPKDEPSWWVKKTIPPNMPRCLVPNIMATRPLVGGTVDSHKKPMQTEKIMMLVGLGGMSKNKVNTAARAK